MVQPMDCWLRAETEPLKEEKHRENERDNDWLSTKIPCLSLTGVMFSLCFQIKQKEEEEKGNTAPLNPLTVCPDTKQALKAKCL